MLALAAQTTRNTPTWFVVFMWTLALVMTLGALWALAAAWNRRGDAPTEGRRAQASCLAVFAVPTLLLGLFFLSWAVGIS
ncbi:hypothetical protein [Calidifontibacter indicus]|uniref:Uncharacterized protein n=2 Tax=Calidifontibacter indicus TaxID=419650 RepID=A0A3D9UIE7_9MICO|nr:hypothetical protein [Calidifontibacter indicus]REF29077.1 hypothetical protein DFJ65_0003 [Calidifontibacter indicus]